MRKNSLEEKSGILFEDFKLETEYCSLDLVIWRTGRSKMETKHKRSFLVCF